MNLNRFDLQPNLPGNPGLRGALAPLGEDPTPDNRSAVYEQLLAGSLPELPLEHDSRFR